MRGAALVVEDEDDVRELLVFSLRSADFEVVAVSTCAAAAAVLATTVPEVVLLDRSLPDADGLTVCESMRRDPRFDDVGVLVLSALGSEEDRVAGLEAGADDYVVKPFSVRELVARTGVLASLARARRAARERRGTSSVLTAGGIVLEPIRHRVSAGGFEIELRPVEFKLLKVLMESPGRTLSRADLVTRLWGDESRPTERVVDTHIRRLRARLGDAAASIETVHREGYRIRT